MKFAGLDFQIWPICAPSVPDCCEDLSTLRSHVPRNPDRLLGATSGTCRDVLLGHEASDNVVVLISRDRSTRPRMQVKVPERGKKTGTREERPGSVSFGTGNYTFSLSRTALRGVSFDRIGIDLDGWGRESRYRRRRGTRKREQYH